MSRLSFSVVFRRGALGLLGGADGGTHAVSQGGIVLNSCRLGAPRGQDVHPCGVKYECKGTTRHTMLLTCTLLLTVAVLKLPPPSIAPSAQLLHLLHRYREVYDTIISTLRLKTDDTIPVPSWMAKWMFASRVGTGAVL